MDIEECESDDALGMQLESNASDERDLSPGVFAGEDSGGSEDTAEHSPSGDLPTEQIGGAFPADCEDEVFQLGQSGIDRAPSDVMALDESEAEGSASFQCSESEDPDSLRAPTWRPGWNCGEWVRGKRAFGEQAQVLITNVYLNLRLLPNTLAAAVLAHLSPGRQVKNNFADKLSGRLLGLSHSAARSVYDRLMGAGWQLAPPESGEPPHTGPPGVVAGSLSELAAMKLRVREILAICHSGRPDCDYPAAMRRIDISRDLCVRRGPLRYHTPPPKDITPSPPGGPAGWGVGGAGGGNDVIPLGGKRHITRVRKHIALI